MPYTVSNATIDTAAAAVPSPYGPLTRVTDVADLPEPNSEIRLEFTSALSETVYATYAELIIPAMILQINQRAHDWTAVVADLKTALNELDVLVDAMATPHTYEDYQAIIDTFRNDSRLQPLFGAVI